MRYYKIIASNEYTEWFGAQPEKIKNAILKRLDNIEYEGYFGTHRDLDEDLWELKFNDGRRIYYVHIPVQKILLLIGGNKNGQEKDIKRARSCVRKLKGH